MGRHMDAPVQPLGCTFTYYILLLYICYVVGAFLPPPLSLSRLVSSLTNTHRHTLHHRYITRPTPFFFFLLPDPFLLEPGR